MCGGIYSILSVYIHADLSMHMYKTMNYYNVNMIANMISKSPEQMLCNKSGISK